MTPATPINLEVLEHEVGGEVIQDAPERRLTIRTPDEILAMEFDDSDNIMGDRIVAEGQPCTILAQGGLGKSRLVLQAAACSATGRKFLAFDTHGIGKRWLILQTENSNRRFKDDLSRLKKWLGDDWAAFSALVKIHTIEQDDDCFVTLESPENHALIESLIEEHSPDIVAIDPLGDFAIGDPNKDCDMRSTCQALSRLVKRGNARRALVVLHHAITGKAGAAKASGYDRASFGRNSKVLQAWTRGQINIVPATADDNTTLIFFCGKCSNGKEFEPFAASLNPETMIYELDPSVDISAWQSDVAGEKAGPTITVAGAVELLDSPTPKGKWVKAIMAESGCGKSHAYRIIERAEKRSLVHYSKVQRTYVPKLRT